MTTVTDSERSLREILDVGEDGAPPAPRHLLVTLFGTFGRTRDNWMSVAAIVRLMETLGVEGSSVRSAISRLKRKNILVAQRRGGSAGYSLSDHVLEVIGDGDDRIFVHRRATAADPWLVAVFSVPESERDKRHLLRATLTRLGFGIVAPGVWVVPAVMADEVRRALRRSGLDEYVDLFAGGHVGFGDLSQKVSCWWDLDAVSREYRQFIDRYAQLAERVSESAPSDEDAFAVYVPMLTVWRRLPYRDPGIPLANLPTDWPAVAAEQIFAHLYEELHPAAERYVSEVDSSLT